MAVNFGNAVTDPKERERITRAGTDFVNQHEARGGGYAPGFSRDQYLDQAIYSFFPSSSPAPGSLASVGGGGGGYGSSGSFTSGSVGYPGTAPSPTPYGNFVAPDIGAPSRVEQALLKRSENAIQRSAAARGTLLNTGTLGNLQQNAQDIASSEYGKDFDRATTTYGLNRGTNAQNFGQQMDQFRGNLDAFNAGDSSALNWANYGLRKDAMKDDAGGTTQAVAATSGGPSAAQSYADYVAQLRQAQQPQSPLLPLATLADPYRRREYRGAGQ